MSSPVVQPPTRKAAWPLYSPHKPPPASTPNRAYNLKLARELVVHMGIIDTCYRMKVKPTFRVVGHATPSQLLSHDAYLQHLTTLDDYVLRRRVAFLRERLLRAAEVIRVSRRDPTLSFGNDEYARRVRVLLEQTQTPMLYLEVFLALIPYTLDEADRVLDELLLRVSMRLWHEGFSRPQTLLQLVRQTVPSSRTMLLHKMSRNNLVIWPCASRSLQFMFETERLQTLELLVSKTTGQRLPNELMDHILTYLLDHDLPDPQRMRSIWSPWPTTRSCGRNTSTGAPLYHNPCPQLKSCPEQLQTRWNGRSHKFEFWHYMSCTDKIDEQPRECLEGRCEPHHPISAGMYDCDPVVWCRCHEHRESACSAADVHDLN